MTVQNADLFNGLDDIENFEDHSVVQSFTSRVTPEGRALARFIGYIDMGSHLNTYKDANTPEEKVKLIFELHDNPNKPAGFNFEVDENGVKKSMPTIHTIELPKKFSDKAKFRKYLKAMGIQKDENTHLMRKLGSAYIVDIKHKKTKAGKDFPVCELDGDVLIKPAVIEDPMTGEVKELPVPAQVRPTQLFVWHKPNKAQWDSIYIEGEYERELEDGTKEKVSRNRNQEMIVSALNYKGSPIEALLSGTEEALAGAIATSKVENPVQEPAQTSPEAQQTVSEPSEVQTPQKEEKTSEKPADKPVDPMAELENALSAL